MQLRGAGYVVPLLFVALLLTGQYFCFNQLGTVSVRYSMPLSAGIHASNSLTIVTDGYIKSLTKKRELEIDPSAGKFLPCESLGTVMMSHGEEFGVESVYGASSSPSLVFASFGHSHHGIIFMKPGAALTSFGRVHCKIGALQEDYATALEETYAVKLVDGITAIKEYQAMRKKLESRRYVLP